MGLGFEFRSTVLAGDQRSQRESGSSSTVLILAVRCAEGRLRPGPQTVLGGSLLRSEFCPTGGGRFIDSPLSFGWRAARPSNTAYGSCRTLKSSKRTRDL